MWKFEDVQPKPSTLRTKLPPRTRIPGRFCSYSPESCRNNSDSSANTSNRRSWYDAVYLLSEDCNYQAII
ncbi:hypothetical protein FQA47_012727 [Oryzias melastigma]|uniref:Uncharacterized protein n=1 Tax=Oryzias melastigma TaxID=30732 RepID=A0A834FHX7_ORYME|nr:hypothetical protein FQA47_012727 [Oryzias melastigma]